MIRPRGDGRSRVIGQDPSFSKDTGGASFGTEVSGEDCLLAGPISRESVGQADLCIPLVAGQSQIGQGVFPFDFLGLIEPQKIATPVKDVMKSAGFSFA